jgi:hypothetical protein
MTTATDIRPEDIRRRIAESCAFLKAASDHWNRERLDHIGRMKEIQAACPHENVSVDVSQVAVTYTCPDCGKALED